jgi:HEAT repeat protein
MNRAFITLNRLGLVPKLTQAAGLALSIAALLATAEAEPNRPKADCFISTGDNNWAGELLPIDSKASIEASFDLLARLGVRRVYWRGLQDATWNEVAHVREENCRYASWWHWYRRMYAEVDPDRTAAAAAKRHGLEFWGVGTLADWGSPADVPCYGIPNDSESTLRLEHPQWVPVDRSGLLKQGGPLEFAYPEARKALVDLHMKYIRRDGYDGMIFLTYVENFGMRFQDEFGFNEPIVQEFKRRTGVDLRTQPFTRSASRYDWYALRGEYLTQYLRELKAQLRGDGKKLGIFVNPQQPHFTQPWPEQMLTAGHIYCDLETWVRDGIIDQLLVYGSCQPTIEERAIDDCLWLTRATPCEVSALAQSPFDSRWKGYRDRGVWIVMSIGEEESYLDRSTIPEQPLAALQGDDPLLRMRLLAQIIFGRTKAAPAQVVPLARDKNVLIRRLALVALGKLKDPASVPVIERGLEDEENCVRCAAARALSDNNRPESAAKMLAAVDRFGGHPLVERVLSTLPLIRPLPRAELAAAARKHSNPVVRSTAMRALVLMPDKTLLPIFASGLHDSDRFARFAAAEGLGTLGHNGEAAEVLLDALGHEDPVVSDRAATSLVMVFDHHSPESDGLLPRVAAGLRKLYGQLGDGCHRVDAEWGYLPVGDALLKLGPEGEQILKSFLDQSHDHRLALQAWKSLYLHRENRAFEVTEKENEEAFRHLPAFLRSRGAAETRQSYYSNLRTANP